MLSSSESARQGLRGPRREEMSKPCFRESLIREICAKTRFSRMIHLSEAGNECISWLTLRLIMGWPSILISGMSLCSKLHTSGFANCGRRRALKFLRNLPQIWPCFAQRRSPYQGLEGTYGLEKMPFWVVLNDYCLRALRLHPPASAALSGCDTPPPSGC